MTELANEILMWPASILDESGLFDPASQAEIDVSRVLSSHQQRDEDSGEGEVGDSRRISASRLPYSRLPAGRLPGPHVAKGDAAKEERCPGFPRTFP
jgi:hypothetical protein